MIIWRKAVGIVCTALLAGGTGYAQTSDWEIPSMPLRVSSGLPAGPVVSVETPFDLVAAVSSMIDRFDHLNQSETVLERLVLDLALDPNAAFAYVRDNITSVAYSGQMRSPEGVLVSGAGNPYDKAAALAEILARMGYDTRFVSSGEQGQAAAVENCAVPKSIDNEVFLVGGLGPDIMARIFARAKASYGALHPHLSPVLQEKGEAPLHVWLQVRMGPDWVNLDPWTTTSNWGEAPFETAVELKELPAPQIIEIRLKGERLKNGKLQESELLRVPFKMPAAAEDRVSLSFGPKTGGVGGILADTLGGLHGIAAPMRAVLTINGVPKYSKVFAAPGVPSSESSLFDQGVEEITTGLWLEIRSSTPAGFEESAIRPIVDLVPTGLREAHVQGAPIDPAQLSQPSMGEKYPIALESLRHIVMSSGSISARREAARGVRDLLRLPETIANGEEGQPDVEALLWSTWLQARRIMLASEELVRVRPIHADTCVVADRPRAMIWGLSGDGNGEILQWVDWALDGIGVAGRDATLQAEQRLWHGAVQSALETEALAWMTLVPADTYAPDKGPMTELTDAQLDIAGPEVSADQAEGFVTLASSATAPGYWWRVDPKSGRADARGRFYGNARYYNPWSNYVNASRGGIAHISEAELAHLERLIARHGGNGQAIADEILRVKDIQQAERARPKEASGNEYVTILSRVSIPVSIEAGAVIATIVIGGILVALYG